MKGYFFLVTSLFVICDGLKDAITQSDSCSVCVKDNSSCRIVSGLFTKPQLALGYNLITQLPKTACNLTITQLKKTNNFLALRRSNGTFILNGNWDIKWSSEIDIGGMKFFYTRNNGSSLESIYSIGSLQETIDLMLIYQEPNHGVKYQYQFPMLRSEALINSLTLSNGKLINSDEKNQINEVDSLRVFDNTFPFSIKEKSLEPPMQSEDIMLKAKHRFRRRRPSWKVVGFTECSKTCGGGIKSPVVLCVREYNSMPVPDKRCAIHQKPTVQNLQCNLMPCQSQWVTGEWTECSVSCGVGIQMREISCKQDILPSIPISNVDDSCGAPPSHIALTQKCVQPPCPQSLRSEWQIGPWSSCSVTCGVGLMTRTIHCPTGNCNKEHPMIQSICEMEPCKTTYHNPSNTNYWLVTEWSEQCSSNCGKGIETRKVKCSGLEQECFESLKPQNSRDCFSNKNCGGQWHVGPWGECSESCGWGKHHRNVICLSKHNNKYSIKTEQHCSGVTKPETEQQCYSSTCESEWYISEWSQCIGECWNGIQTRMVQCFDDNMVVSKDCKEDKKPQSQKHCLPDQCSQSVLDNVIVEGYSEQEKNFHFQPIILNINDNAINTGQPPLQHNHTSTDITPLKMDSTNNEDCKDLIHNCNLVVQARLCKYKYYNSSCCHSCQH